jgi:ABC-type nitrate/sulfonate/bicarbonate transport system permease component
MKRNLFIGPTLFILIWWLLSKSNCIDPFLLPGPFETVRQLFYLFFNGEIFPDFISTLQKVFISFLIASVVGLPLGLLLGSSEKIYRSFEFIIDFFRSTPPTAIFPLFLLIFGVTDQSKIAVAAFASMLIIIFNTAYGLMNAKKARLLAAKIMGASRWQIFKSILFWESLPQTFIGLRSAISLSLIVIIVTEMFIGTNMGLGKKIIDAQITYEIKTMYAIILFTGIIGYALNFVFQKIEKRFLHWASK